MRRGLSGQEGSAEIDEFREFPKENVSFGEQSHVRRLRADPPASVRGRQVLEHCVDEAEVFRCREMIDVSQRHESSVRKRFE